MSRRAQEKPPLPRLLGVPASAVYAWEVGRRNRRFDRLEGVTRLDRPVISVGNLSMGGTGKTPMVHLVVRTLRDGGHAPCIAMRGYRAKPGEIGDEEGEHRRSLPGVPVVAQPDRLAGLVELFSSSAGVGVDVVVLDDGFQHRRIARDLDIVLLDASRSVFGDRPFPAGWLREPVQELARAQMLVLTHAERVDERELAEQRANAQRVAPGALVVEAEHAWSGLIVHHGGEQTAEPVSWLSGRRVAACCGIGHPRAFLAQLAEHVGTERVAALELPDHAAYTPARLERARAMAEQAEALVTTAKDWSKLASTGALSDLVVVVPTLEIRVRGDRAPFEAAIRSAAAGRTSD